MTVRDWLDERTGYRSLGEVLRQPMVGGASFAYVTGAVVLFFFALQAVTGALLSFYYSPSATDAWASVAYVEDQVTMGSFVRGLHHHGASAMVVSLGAHLILSVVRGSYYRPREATWWIAVLAFMVVMAFALTGDLLPWDQNGYWATRVRLGYAGAAPGGAQVESGILGGNELGNLTLTRFHALHVAVLPALAVGLGALALALARRHGAAPPVGRSDGELAQTTRPFWPDQMFRNAVAVAIAFGALVAWTIHTGGAGLTAPADPSAAFDARPSWFERALFQLVRMMPASLEAVVALSAPLVGMLGLLGLPLVDRGPDRSLGRRAWVLVLTALTLIGLAFLTVASYRADERDKTFVENRAVADTLAAKARRLAREHGVPVAGGTAVYTTTKFYRARALWTEHCESCHDGKERKGPLIGAGYNNRAWIRGMLATPSGDEYFGRTKIGKSEEAMPAAEVDGADLDALVELVYAESGAPDVDAKLVARGGELFSEQPCGDCHERTGEGSSSGPNLAGRGTVPHLLTLIGDTGQARFFGEKHEMPRFADELGPEDRRQLAEYVVWLRTATPADIEHLED